MQKPRKAEFLVLEGGEGAGKSTMAQFAEKYLLSKGIPVLRSREPGGSPYGEMIRELILSPEAKNADAETMFALFWASRRDHLVNTVAPALAEGTSVICDRFDSSTYGYQIVGQGQGQLRHLFTPMRKHYLAHTWPSWYILLDVHPEIGLGRAKNRQEGLTHFDERDLEFHTRVNKALYEFVRTLSGSDHVVIDANQPQKVVEQRVIDTLDHIFSIGEDGE